MPGRTKQPATASRHITARGLLTPTKRRIIPRIEELNGNHLAVKLRTQYVKQLDGSYRLPFSEDPEQLPWEELAHARVLYDRTRLAFIMEVRKLDGRWYAKLFIPRQDGYEKWVRTVPIVTPNEKWLP